MEEQLKILETRYLREKQKNTLLEKFIEDKSRELYLAQAELKTQYNLQSSVFQQLFEIIHQYKNTDSIESSNKAQEFQNILSLVTELKIIIRELEEAKVKAESAAVARSRFLANMSHEIRTPMNGIMGLAKLLENTAVNEKQQKYLSAIITSSDTLLAIINDILDISKVNAGKMEVGLKEFNLNFLLKSLLSVFEEKAKTKGLKMIYKSDDNLPSKNYLGDAVRLNQILYNLMGNALKFTHQGEVTLSIRVIEVQDEKIKIAFSVKDTGIGIPYEKQEIIFNPFVQVNDESTRQFGGVGLGLSIVKQMVELLKGQLTLVSEPDKGSEFTFILDFLQVENNTCELKPENNFNDLAKRNITALLVEDNPINQMFAKDLLESKNISVVTANNGKEGIEEYAKADFDIVLMDMQMPVMDGYDATKYIRSNFPETKNKVPILAITAHVMEGELEKCTNAGVSAYLSKPYQPKDLFTSITALIDGQQMNQSLKQNIMATNEERKSLFNSDKLLMAMDDDKALADKVKNMMIEELPKDMARMEEALANKEWERVGAIAHYIKPNIRMCSTDEMYEDVYALEKDGKGQMNIESIPQRMDKLKKDIITLIQDMQKI